MVLLVPDGDDVTETASSVPEQPKAQLDDSEASKATQKVDLDLDDAPFLEDEEDEEEIAEVEDETPMRDDEDDEGPDSPGLAALLKNKFVLIGAGVILILLVVIVILLLREPEAPPPPPPPPAEEKQPDAAPVVEETPEILIRLDPFLIEQMDEDGKIRFLEVRILLSTEEEGLAKQFKQETYTVRNALFYYLKNKDLQFLSDKENSDKLKQELLAIVNQYMGFGQFNTLLFDRYLVR